jgi:cytochrome c biogenesis protein
LSKKEEKGLFSSLKDSLSSLKLTIALLIILAIASIFGTVIPQNASQEEYLRVYQFSTYKILKILGLLDMYHAGWFIFFLALLSVNLIVCSLKRLRITWKFFSPEVRLSDRQWENPSPGKKFFCRELPDHCFSQYRQALAKIFSPPKFSQAFGIYHLLAEKGLFSRMGVYCIHLSILVILAGGLIGSFYGFRGNVDLLEGQTTDRAILRNGQQAPFPGFSVKLEKFSVSFYSTGAPKEFKSILTLMDKNRKILTESILVNHPLTYKGISFYQSRYEIAGLEKAILVLKDRELGKEVSIAAQMGKRTEVPGDSTFFLLDHFLPDFQGLGPALQIILSEPDRPQQKFWVFQNPPKFAHQRPGRYQVTIKEIAPKYYSGLQVTKDPGVGVVWAGCLIMIAGFYLAFFMSHRRIWVRLTGKEGGTLVEVAGSSHRDRIAFEKEFEKIAEALRDSQGPEEEYQEREGQP